MFGNRLGWLLSAALMIMVGTATWALNSYIEAVSARTAFSFDPAHGAVIALAVPPGAVWPAMRDPSDAGDIYRRALAATQADDIAYFKFLRSGQREQIDSVPAINTLCEATSHNRAAIFADHPEQVVNYDGDQSTLTALLTVGQCARRTGQLLAADQPERARDFFAATFALGARLYEERLTYAELNAGLTLMAEGGGMLQTVPAKFLPDLLGDTARRFDASRKTLVVDQLDPMNNVIASVDQATVEGFAGDVFYFAQNAPERMWRVEAVLKLGRYRFNAGRIGDQRSARRTLKKLAAENDPVIRAAANAALNLTLDQYRMIK